MDIGTLLKPFEERCERIKELSDEDRKRLYLMIGDVEESVGIDHIVDCLAEKTSMAGDGVLRCYVGFEPSGKAHIGWKVLSLQLKRMLEADANVLIFLADWHAWVNDKFGGNMEDIQQTAVYMEETFRALLDHPEEGDGPWSTSISLGKSINGFRRLLGPSTSMFKGCNSSYGSKDLHDHGA